MALTRSLSGCVPCRTRVTWSFCACAWQIQFVFSWERAVFELLPSTRLEQPPAKRGNKVHTKKSVLTYTSRQTLHLPWPTRGGFPKWVGTGHKNHARNRVRGMITNKIRDADRNFLLYFVSHLTKMTWSEFKQVLIWCTLPATADTLDMKFCKEMTAGYA